MTAFDVEFSDSHSDFPRHENKSCTAFGLCGGLVQLRQDSEQSRSDMLTILGDRITQSSLAHGQAVDQLTSLVASTAKNLESALRGETSSLAEALRGEVAVLTTKNDEKIDGTAKKLRVEIAGVASTLRSTTSMLGKQMQTQSSGINVKIANTDKALRDEIKASAARTATRVGSLESQAKSQGNKLSAILDCNNQGKLFVEKSGKCGASAGATKTESTHPTCNSGTTGTIRFNTKKKQIEFCADNKWSSVASVPTGTGGNPHVGTCSSIREEVFSANGAYHFVHQGKTKQAYCKFDSEGSWVLAMVIAADTRYQYGSSIWTSSSTEGSCLDPKDTSNCKHWAFNDISTTDFEIKTQWDQVRLAGQSGSKTMRQRFAGGQELLLRKSGASRPSYLFGKNYATCGHPWRINSSSRNTNMASRVGGPITYWWGCGYGSDSTGQPTGASVGGIGLKDQTWAPYSKDLSGAGIRHAHDYDYGTWVRSSATVFVKF